MKTQNTIKELKKAKSQGLLTFTPIPVSTLIKEFFLKINSAL